jgi:hypothetical protein
MDAVMAVNWTEMRRAQTTRVKVDDQIRAVQLARDNMRLLEENERLRHANADLAASAEIWIRLYEAALARAKQPSPLFSRFDSKATRQ